MDNAREMNMDELEKVTGGQYDPDVEYNKAQVKNAGNLYSVNNIRQIVGQIQPGQEVELHPEFEYYIDGKIFCIIRVNGVDYITERDNVS